MIAATCKLWRKLLCLAVTCGCAGTAYAGPAGPVVSAGSATYAPATLTVTSSSAHTHISWPSFNVAAGEVVRFVQPNAQSSVLNHIFNPQSLNILGGLNSNGSVLFLSSGIVSGPGMNLDLAGVIDTSLRLPRMAFALGGAASATRPASLTTLADGRIYVISGDERAVTTANGDVVLNPGNTIELANADMPNLRVGLTAPRGEAINLSRLVASKGDTGIFAGLFRVPAAARQAAERDADAVLTASAEERRPATPDMARFYRYAQLFAQMRGAVAQDEGGMMNVAAVPATRMMLPAARSRSSLLPQDIEIGAPARRSSEAAVAASSSPVPAAPAAVATLEPQPIPAAGENEPERNRVTLLALAPILPSAEVVATLEPQPIAVTGENEPERNRVALLAFAPILPVTEAVATLEPQPVLLRQTVEPEDIRTLAYGQLAAAPTPAEPGPAAASGQGNDRAQGRQERKLPATVIVVALAQHSAASAPREDARVKEVRIERRAPRYFTDHRGAMFFM